MRLGKDEAKLKGFHKLELTINCDNKASYILFERIASKNSGCLKNIGEYKYKDSNEIIYSIEF